MSAGQRRFARRLWVERQPPAELAGQDRDQLIDGLDSDGLSWLIWILKGQPYRRGENRLAR